MEKKPRALVIYPSPGRIHLNPVVELSKLITRDHPSLSVTIITSSLPHDSSAIKSYASKVSNASINFIHLEAPLVSSYDQGSFPDPSLASVVRELLAAKFEITKLNNPALRETLLKLSQNYNVRALVMDYFNHFALEVSSSLNLPAYFFRTQGAFCANYLLYLPAIDKSMKKNSIKDLDPDFPVEFPGVPPIPCKDMKDAFTDRTHRVYSYLVDASEQLAKSNGIIVNTFEALEQSTLETILEGKCTPGEPRVPPVFCVGPLLTPSRLDGGGEYPECLTWLNSQPSKSVLFLCFGRFGVFSSSQLKEIATGLERSGVRFLWVVRNPPGTATKEIELESLLPLGFLERTKERGMVVRNWAPQLHVLNHASVGGFVTHCGWSSVMEAVQSGVPMLAWPLYAEQKMNRVYLVEGLNMALGLKMEEDGWVSSGELEQKMTELMSSEGGDDLRERAAHMKKAALEALDEGGSSRVAIVKLVQSF